MKINYLFLCLSFVLNLNAQIINVADTNFKTKLLSSSQSNDVAKDLNGNYFAIDINGDNEIQLSEAINVKALNISFALIYSVSGIENFTNLEFLNCSNNEIFTLDLINLTGLKELNCSSNYINTIDLENLTLLENLNCEMNQFTSLDVNGLSHLNSLVCGYNDLPNLTVTGLVNLLNLDCSGNYLTDLNIQGLSNLRTLSCRINQLSTINFSGLENLEILNCEYNQITTLDAGGLNNLQYLRCSLNQITSLNLTGLSKLLELYCNNNHLSTLNANGLSQLIYLDCTYNQLNAITLIGSNNLQRLECRNNSFTTLNLSNTSHLEFLGCQQNLQLSSLYIKNAANESVNSNGTNGITYVCADDFQIWTIQSHFGVGCLVDTECDLSTKEETIIANKIKMYPNPVKNILTIDANYTIIKIEIYNNLGQLILKSTAKTIDVSNLKPGNYLVLLSTNEGNIRGKFLKE